MTVITAHVGNIRNTLLAALPPDQLAQMRPSLRPVVFSQLQVLQAAGAPIDTVFFPEGGWVSLVLPLQDGGISEVGLIGAEGMVGLPLALGIDTAFTEALVQHPGVALSMSGASFGRMLDDVPALRPLLLRYNEALQAQVSQTAACNGNHQVKQRLARWLLMAHDRTEGDGLTLTQELLALMLGVHRPSVSLVAASLQQAGLIRYSQGAITITDRPGLEGASCECYRVVADRYRQLLGRHSFHLSARLQTGRLASPE